MSKSPAQQPGLAIPYVVKRNTLLLALAQTVSGAGGMMAYSLGPLMVVSLLRSAALAGLSVSLLALSRLIVAYPVGRLTDAYGRKPAMYLGLGLAMLGGVVTGLSMLAGSVALLVAGLLVLGMGLGATHQLRVAAADMYPPSRRAEGLGYVMTGSLIGIVGGPLLITAANVASTPLRLEPMGLAWLLLPLLILPGLYCVSQVRPDPKQIGAQLEAYYPDYRPERQSNSQPQERVHVRALLRRYPLRVAFAANFAAFGSMSVVMMGTSLALAHHGHTLPAIAMSHALHTAGMFAFSLPLGWLADRLGRRVMIFYGGVTTSVGALLVGFTPEYWSITLGTFLVGLGWSAVNVAATALIADTTTHAHRGRAVGLNDSIASIGSITLPLMAGPMAESFGLGSTAALSACLMLAPLVLLIWLREPRPGTYLVAGTRALEPEMGGSRT